MSSFTSALSLQASRETLPQKLSTKPVQKPCSKKAATVPENRAPVPLAKYVTYFHNESLWTFANMILVSILIDSTAHWHKAMHLHSVNFCCMSIPIHATSPGCSLGMMTGRSFVFGRLASITSLRMDWQGWFLCLPLSGQHLHMHQMLFRHGPC